MANFLDIIESVLAVGAGQYLEEQGQALQAKYQSQAQSTETSLTESLGLAGQKIGQGFSKSAIPYLLIFVGIIVLVFFLMSRRR